MPLSVLRNIDVVDGEEEKLLQEVIDAKVQIAPPVRPINRSDVPDIKTAEEEAKWQAIIDQRVADTMPKKPEMPVKQEDDFRPFCQFCTSLGYRHKKNCTRPQK